MHQDTALPSRRWRARPQPEKLFRDICTSERSAIQDTSCTKAAQTILAVQAPLHIVVVVVLATRCIPGTNECLDHRLPSPSPATITSQALQLAAQHFLETWARTLKLPVRHRGAPSSTPALKVQRRHTQEMATARP